tara:strand:+ start:1347 stop:1868 length:522 start_codon:yes stop_codon:yes gene_type:complete
VALYGGSRDISLFRHINRELMHDIISQQIVYHKYNLEETKVNIYGETTSGRIFQEPVLLYTLIERSDQSSPILDGVVNFNQPITFKFLRADLVDANVVTEEGDIIQWQNAYWEIDNIISNQYFVGKNPDYPNTDSTGTNPLESDLADFGTSLSLICNAHYVPADRIGLDKQRI